MDNRGQFTFYRSFWEAVQGFPKKDRLPILEAIISYALDAKVPGGLSQSQLAFFSLVKPTLDASRRKAANGKLGGKSEKANRKQTESKTEANRKQTESEKEGEKENEKENEIEIEIENEDDKEQSESNAPFSGKLFTVFWDAYPRKIDRNGAWEAWKALRPDQQTGESILASLEAWKRSNQWTDDGGRFIPEASKFLYKEYWRATPPPPQAKGMPKGASGTLGAAELENIQRLLRED